MWGYSCGAVSGAGVSCTALTALSGAPPTGTWQPPVIIEEASHTYNAIHPLVHVPVALSMAALITGHFISAYA